MEQRDYDKLEKMLCKELKEVTDKGELSAGSLDTVDKLTHALKNVYKIKMGYQSEYAYGDSYGRGYGENYSGRYNDRGDYSRRDSYGDYSEGRRRHYVRGHYSYDDGMAMVEERINEMMQGQGVSQHDREVLRQALEVLR